MSKSTCAVCSILFVPRTGGKPQLYCSPPCRQSAENAQRRTRTRNPGDTVACEWCGTPVAYAGKGRPPKYCFNACRIKGCTPPEVKRQYNQAFMERNPGYYAERQKAYRDADPEKYRESVRRYYATHSEQWDRYRSARSHLFRPEDLDYTTWALVAARFAMWGGKCWICGVPAEARDHVKPLSKGGRHLPANIRPICHSCNSRKNARWPFPCSPAWPANFAGRKASDGAARTAV